MVIYSALFNAYPLTGNTDSANICFERMAKAGLKLDIVTYSAVIVDRAAMRFEQREKAGLELNMVSYSALSNAYARKADTDGSAKNLKLML